MDIILQGHLGASRHLMKFIKSMIQLNVVENGNVMLVDPPWQIGEVAASRARNVKTWRRR